MDPCRLTLSISGGSAGSAWYPTWVAISVRDEGVVDVLKYSYLFKVNDWVYEGYHIERREGMCIYGAADSST
jgi:hypothetical protein